MEQSDVDLLLQEFEVVNETVQEIARYLRFQYFISIGAISLLGVSALFAIISVLSA